MLNILSVFLATLSSAFRTHAALQVEILALRHQIGVLQRSARKRPKLTPLGVHLKTGHTWPLQNRPTELNQDKSIYNPPTAISANIFRNPA
jgi:hypothetical protein